MNLLFNEGIAVGKDGEVFVQLTASDLPLERADEATYSFEMGGPLPLVAPDEAVISKEVQAVGNKEALVLITEQGDNYVTRYFLKHQSEQPKLKASLYMFRFRTPISEFNGEEYQGLLSTIEEMITSMEFLR